MRPFARKNEFTRRWRSRGNAQTLWTLLVATLFAGVAFARILHRPAENAPAAPSSTALHSPPVIR